MQKSITPKSLSTATITPPRERTTTTLRRTTVAICATIIVLMLVGTMNITIIHQTVSAQLEQPQPEQGQEYVSSSARVTGQEAERAAATSEAEYNSDSLSQRLDYAHFIPLTNSPGNQVKLLINYSSQDPSITNTPMNAVMEIYGANQSLIRTTSFPQPILLNESGIIQLATTFEDENLNNVTAKTMLTDGEKVIPISNTLETRLALGQNITGIGQNITGIN